MTAHDTPGHDHEIRWLKHPYLLAVPVGQYVGTCIICGATFIREQRVAPEPAAAPESQEQHQ